VIVRPRVSVVITTYRRPEVLPRAIRSALAQTVREIEVIVVDDEPSEAAREATASVSDDRVSYLPHPSNRGLSAARNSGIEAARGRFIAFLDDDDEWVPEKLELQLAVISTQGPDVVVTSYELWQSPDGERIRNIDLDGDVHRRLLRDDVVHMQTLLLPKSAFDVVGSFDEELFHHEDLDMALRLSRCYRFVTVKQPLTVIHVTPGSLSRNTSNRIRAIERILEKTPELRGRRLRSRWVYRLARLHAEAGDEETWRRLLVEATRLDPSNVRAASVLLLGTALGPDAHLRLAMARGRMTRRLRAVPRPRRRTKG
jgi:glycosyltransferase involved in cell wall biosynthesis